MEMLKNIIDYYFTFHYGIGCVIGVVIFCSYIYILRRRQKSQGQSVSVKDILCGLVLSIYLVFLLGGTVLNRTVGEEYRLYLKFFWSYREVFATRDTALLWQIVYNILVFIPWGILLPEIVCVASKFRVIVLRAAGLSLVIEVAQLVFKLGLFEFDDVFHNTLGAVIGYGVWRVSCVWREEK